MLSKAIKIPVAVLAVIISLTACTYYPPDGYTEQHHTYEDALAFAEAIDPSAVLDEEYSDTVSDSWNLNFREWNAVINGIDCHVASAGELVWNRGFLGGEFPKEFYRMDTDYDYYALESLLAEKQPEWRIAYNDAYHRYDPLGYIYVKNSYPTGRKLTDEELDSFFDEVYEIEKAYNDKSLNKSVGFYLSVPTVCMNGSTGEKKYIVIDEIAFFDIYENGKAAFLDEYNSKWDRLNSGLPIKE